MTLLPEIIYLVISEDEWQLSQGLRTLYFSMGNNRVFYNNREEAQYVMNHTHHRARILAIDSFKLSHLNLEGPRISSSDCIPLRSVVESWNKPTRSQ